MNRRKIDSEIIAVITAAISMHLSSTKFRIVSLEERKRKISRWKKSAVRHYWRYIL